MPIAYFAYYMNIVMFVFNLATCVVYKLTLPRTVPIELFGSKIFDLAL